MAFRYVFFDLDGTLTDSFEGITKSVQFALEHFGITISDRNKLRCFIGPPLKEQFAAFAGFTEEQAVEAVATYRVRYREIGWKECELIEGAEKTLKALKEKGLIIALATSKPELFATKIIEHLGLRGYFDFISGADFEGKKTHKPDVIRYALDELGVTEPSSVLMVGDTKFDIEGAKICGVKSAGVLCGFGSREEMQAQRADFIVETLEEIIDIAVK